MDFLVGSDVQVGLYRHAFVGFDGVQTCCVMHSHSVKQRADGPAFPNVDGYVRILGPMDNEIALLWRQGVCLPPCREPFVVAEHRLPSLCPDHVCRGAVGKHAVDQTRAVKVLRSRVAAAVCSLRLGIVKRAEDDALSQCGFGGGSRARGRLRACRGRRRCVGGRSGAC